jgi:ribosomal protein L7/L12
MSEVGYATVLIVITLGVLFRGLSTLQRRVNRLSRLEAKVDALLKDAGIEFDEFADVPPDVRAALERGQTIAAIKHYREATGVDLKAAKTFVDEIRRRRTVP